jgi:hypothetical protein
MKYRVVIKYEIAHHNKYIELFNSIDHTKIKSIGSIVMMKDELPWHDYLMDSNDFLEFYEHFENFEFTQIKINKDK